MTDHDILKAVWAKVGAIEETGAMTLAQVRATNGRVTKLENWRWFITGGLAVVGVIVVPLFLKVVSG